MFGRPQGVLGKVGGFIMARTNKACGAWATDLLEVGPDDTVLEVGFGPGVIVERLAKLASRGHVSDIDPSREMVQQARARNSIAIQNGRVDLRRGSVDSLPFTTTASRRCWRSIQCKSGRMRWLDCGKYGAS